MLSLLLAIKTNNDFAKPSTIYKIDNKTPKVEKSLHACSLDRVNRFDHAANQNLRQNLLKIIVLNKSATSRKKYSNSTKLKQLTKARHNSQFLLLSSLM
jgi:hypothetical protein